MSILPIERIEKRCLKGLLDPQQVKVAVFNFFKLRWSISTCLNIHNTNQASMTRVYGQRKVKHATLQECKGMGLECANAIGDMEIFGVVPIGGAIAHPCSSNGV